MAVASRTVPTLASRLLEPRYVHIPSLLEFHRLVLWVYSVNLFLSRFSRCPSNSCMFNAHWQRVVPSPDCAAVPPSLSQSYSTIRLLGL